MGWVLAVSKLSNVRLNLRSYRNWHLDSTNVVSCLSGCTKSPETISSELVSLVRSTIGPVAAFRNSVAVSALPRTRSGKTARKSLADMAAGKPLVVRIQY
jgi:hypothetical protein